MQSLLREGAIVPNAATEASDVDVSEQSPFADMKDNLAPISDKAIKAYLFDLVKNSTNPKLFGGVKPTSSVMVQEKAEGTTLKKFIDESKDRLSNPKANIPRGDLEAMKEKLTKTHSALVSTSYMWANEGLFGSVMSSIQNDPLLKTQAVDPQPLLNNDAVIYP